MRTALYVPDMSLFLKTCVLIDYFIVVFEELVSSSCDIVDHLRERLHESNSVVRECGAADGNSAIVSDVYHNSRSLIVQFGRSSSDSLQIVIILDH